jgi:hypothetical protein
MLSTSLQLNPSRTEAAAQLGIPALVSLTMLARALGCSPPALYRAARAGQLKAAKIGSRFYTTPEAVQAFVAIR